MLLLFEGNMDGVGLLILGVALYWLIPIILLIAGLILLRKRPISAKILLIIAGIMLLAGAGYCGGLLVGENLDLLLLYWLIPLLLLIVGSIQKKTKPEIGKKLISIAVIMLIIGLGTCGLLFLVSI